MDSRRNIIPKGKKENKKMSEQNIKTKSNAPWILGIVGIFLTILHYACAVVCSAAVASGDEVFGGADKASAQQTMDNGMFVANIGAGLMILCFILSFFGKSGKSKLTGLLLIVGGIASACISIAHFSAAGIAAGIVYLCAGISSICNCKKVKA